ncbi:MAG: hypothetical protein QW247_06125 [Pyrobaculum sp.]
MGRTLRHEPLTVGEWCFEMSEAVRRGDKAAVASLLDYLDHELKTFLDARELCPDLVDRLVSHVKYVARRCVEEEPWWNKPLCLKLQEAVDKFPQEEKPWDELPLTSAELLKKLSDVLGFLYVKP